MKTVEFNEIIFENRNQEYGAYMLRKSYKKRMLMAITISIVLLLMAVSYPLIAGYLNKQRIILETNNVTVNLLDINDDVTPPPPPPPLLQQI
jgi:protein TonB